MNLIMSIWSRAVESESDVFVRSFADDATVEVERPDPSIAAAQLQKAISVTEEFTTLSGQKPNVGKCHVWSTSRKGRKALRGLKMLGKPLVQKWHAKDLGCQTLFCGPARSTFLQARFAKARETAKRVQCAPLRLEDKVQLVTGAASSLANYGLETCFIGESACSCPQCCSHGHLESSQTVSFVACSAVALHSVALDRPFPCPGVSMSYNLETLPVSKSSSACYLGTLVVESFWS